jgi:probable F420-dependent oxidoreductase
MRFGTGVPLTRDVSFARDFIETVEGLGFSSLWQGDHVVIPDKISSEYPFAWRFDPNIDDLFPNFPILEACTGLAFLAATSKKAMLGTSVLVVPMRNPIFLAKQLASVSVLLGGRRLKAGIGVGWMKEEIELLGGTWEHRGPRTDEAVDIMQQLWKSEGPVAYNGKYMSFDPIRFDPKPIPGTIDIWVGGHTEIALKRTAKYATGWFPVELTPEEIERGYNRIQELQQRFGRTDRIELACTRRFRLSGDDISETIRLVKAYEKLGMDHLVVMGSNKRTGRENLKRLERFAREVFPEVRVDPALEPVAVG